MKDIILNELKGILETVPSINKVSHGKPEALSSEQVFNAIYIMPDASTFEQRTNTKCLDGYYDIFNVSLLVNTKNDNDLDYMHVERNILNYVLDDSKIWTTTVNIEVVSVGYDRYENYPKKEFIIQLEFRLKYK